MTGVNLSSYPWSKTNHFVFSHVKANRFNTHIGSLTEYMINNNTLIETFNRLGSNRIPFLFILDFDLKRPLIFPIHSLQDSTDIYYQIGNIRNFELPHQSYPYPTHLIKYPVSYDQYLIAFRHVQQAILRGDSFLVNLTQPTLIETHLDLLDIFHASHAKYKLYYKDQFVLFSPETFVEIKQGMMYAYPMKGTIDANIPMASERILSDKKEMAEHVTIVDLIRNDMSMHARKVSVDKFRYIDNIHTDKGTLLQVSSQISGELPQNYHQLLGDIIINMLPAGSISGAPKPKTLDIIRQAEGYHRGYYTGVFGIFDGESLFSAVMIRFIENQMGQLIYKSGGGITAMSDPEKEYQELIQKVYVPIVRKHKGRSTKDYQSHLSRS